MSKPRFTIKNRRVLIGVNVAAAIIVPFLYLVMGELSSGRDFEGLRFLADKPSVSIISCVFFLLIYLAVLFLSRRPATACAAVGGICIVMAYANLAAITFRGQPLVPADIFMAKDAIAMSPEVRLPYNIEIFLFLILVIAVSVALGCARLPDSKKDPIERLTRVVYGITCILLTVLYLRFLVFDKDFLIGLGYEPEPTVKVEYEKNGLYSTFITKLDTLFPKRPDSYNTSTIENIRSQLSHLSVSDEQHCPDIILVLDESLSTPYPLGELEFSQELFDNISALRSECVAGNLISPEYGGGTSNIEFEVLTGLSTDSDSMTAIPFNDYMYADFPSITNYLKSRCGYSTYALHPYNTLLYNRVAAYSDLGFERFLDETSFDNPELAGGYITDAEAVKKIIELYEDGVRAGGPVFIHTVTMQNHMPYLGREIANPLEITGGMALPDECVEGVTTYATLVNLSDDAIGSLVEYFKSVKRDVIVIVYGDHQPIIETEEGVSVLDACGVTDTLSDSELALLTHVTPYIVWSNMERPADTFGTLTPSVLLPTVLTEYGAAEPAYFRWIYAQSTSGSILSRSGDLVVNRDGTTVPCYLVDDKSELNNYSAVIYDIIWNKGTSFGQSLY